MVTTRRFLHTFWQLVAGGICVAGGFVAVFLGWYGAAHTRDVTDQIPYVISGGLLGAALIILGGSFYFSFFVSRLHAATRRQTMAIERSLERIGVPSPIDIEAGVVLIAPGGEWYHRAGCRLVEGKKTSAVAGSEAQADGLQPCLLCEPA